MWEVLFCFAFSSKGESTFGIDILGSRALLGQPLRKPLSVQWWGRRVTQTISGHSTESLEAC